MLALRPQTPAGRWSVWLVVGFALGMGGLFLAVSLGERGGDDFTANWWLSAPALSGAACGIAAFFVGVTAIVRGERSVVVFLAALAGFFVTSFVAAELAFPH